MKILTCLLPVLMVAGIAAVGERTNLAPTCYPAGNILCNSFSVNLYTIKYQTTIPFHYFPHGRMDTQWCILPATTSHYMYDCVQPTLFLQCGHFVVCPFVVFSILYGHRGFVIQCWATLVLLEIPTHIRGDGMYISLQLQLPIAWDQSECT